jgi:hypothetical protein
VGSANGAIAGGALVSRTASAGAGLIEGLTAALTGGLTGSEVDSAACWGTCDSMSCQAAKPMAVAAAAPTPSNKIGLLESSNVKMLRKGIMAKPIVVP